MNIDHLKYFLTILHYNSFSLAAEHLCISQSSLSKHIKSLETELGLNLIERHTRSLSLTPAGEYFLLHANKILETYNYMIESIESYKTKETTNLTLGTIPIVSQYKISALIASFSKKYPNIKLEILEDKGDKLLALINEKKLDLAFIRTINASKTEHNITPLITDELVLVVAKNHRLSSRTSISLSEVKNENFILLDYGSSIYNLCINSCASSGFIPNILYTNTRIESILGLIKETNSVSLLMDKVLNSFNINDFSVIKLDKKVKSTLSLVTSIKNNISPTANIFKDYTKKWFKKKR